MIASCSSTTERHGCMQLSQRSSIIVLTCLPSQFLLHNSWMSLRAKNLLISRKFWSEFYPQNSTYFISLYYYCARSNPMKWTFQCDAILWRHRAVRYINGTKYVFLFPLVQKVKKPSRNTGVIFKNSGTIFMDHGVVYQCHSGLLAILIKSIAIALPIYYLAILLPAKCSVLSYQGKWQ